MVAELSDKSFPKTMCPQDTKFSSLPASGWQILVEFRGLYKELFIIPKH